MDQPWECTTSPLTAFEEVAKKQTCSNSHNPPPSTLSHCLPLKKILAVQKRTSSHLAWHQIRKCFKWYPNHLRTTWKYQYSTKKLSWDVCWYIKKSPQCEIDVNQKFPGPIFLTFFRNFSFHGTNSLIWSSKNDNPACAVFPSHFFATINSRG